MSMDIKTADRLAQVFNRLRETSSRETGPQFSMPTQQGNEGIVNGLKEVASGLLANPEARSKISDFASNLFNNDGPQTNLVAIESKSGPKIDPVEKRKVCIAELNDLQSGVQQLSEYMGAGGNIAGDQQILDFIEELKDKVSFILNSCGDVLPEEEMARVRQMRDQLDGIGAAAENNELGDALQIAGDIAASAAEAAAMVAGFLLNGVRRMLPQH